MLHNVYVNVNRAAIVNRAVRKSSRPAGRAIKKGDMPSPFSLPLRQDYFSASNTRCVMSSTLPSPLILRYCGGDTFAEGSPLLAQSE